MYGLYTFIFFYIMERFMLRKGAWTEEEDDLLKKCILKFGEGRWHQVPLKAGLNRCRKSCRMRWLNYLKPSIKRGEFKEDEVDLILKLHRLLGNRWSMIAGRIPGRTANDIKNYWNTHLKTKKQHHRLQKSKKKIPIRSNIINNDVDDKEATSTLVDSNNNVNLVKTTVFKPRPRTFSKNTPWAWKSNNDDLINNNVNVKDHDHFDSSKIQNQVLSMESSKNIDDLDLDKWWESLLFDKEDKVKDSEKCVANNNNNWWESLLLEEENYCLKENIYG